MLSRVSPVSFLLFSNIFLCVCISIFCRCFQVRHLDQGFCFCSCPSPAAGQRGETVRAYLGGFKRWRRWALFNHFCHLPVNPFQFALYLRCRLNEVNCPQLLNELFTIDLTQNLAGFPKISDHPLVSSMISVAQRTFGRPRDKKDPVTPEMLKALAESKLKGKSPSLSVLRTVATFTVLL